MTHSICSIRCKSNFKNRINFYIKIPATWLAIFNWGSKPLSHGRIPQANSSSNRSYHGFLPLSYSFDQKPLSVGTVYLIRQQGLFVQLQHLVLFDLNFSFPNRLGYFQTVSIRVFFILTLHLQQLHLNFPRWIRMLPYLRLPNPNRSGLWILLWGED